MSSPFIPEVLRCRIDGTVAVQVYIEELNLFWLAHCGPRATRQFSFRGRPLYTREMLLDLAGFEFVRLDDEAEAYARGQANAEDRLAPNPPEALFREVTWRPSDAVPCGDPDRHCGLRGGTARCGGCKT